MIRNKKKITYFFLLSFLLLHFITIIQFGVCTNTQVVWNFTAGDEVRDVAISDDGSTIVVVGYDKNVHLFNNRNNTPIWSYPASDYLFYTTLSSNGSYIVTGSSGGKVRFFEKSNPEPLWSYQTGASVGSLAICPDGSYIAAGSSYYVHLFDKNGPTPFRSYQTVEAHMYSLTISSNGELIAATSSSADRGNTYLFNKSKNSPLWVFKSIWTDSVAMSSDGSYIVSGCGIGWPVSNQHGNIILFHRSSPNPLWYYNTTYPISTVAISSNGLYIAATAGEYYGGVNHKLYFFKRNYSNPIWIYNLKGYPTDLAMSNDGRNVVVGLKSNLICSFDTYAKILKWEFPTLGQVESVDISSEGDSIVGADDWGNVWLLRNISPSTPIASILFFLIPLGIMTTTTLIILFWKILNNKKKIKREIT